MMSDHASVILGTGAHKAHNHRYILERVIQTGCLALPASAVASRSQA